MAERRTESSLAHRVTDSLANQVEINRQLDYTVQAGLARCGWECREMAPTQDFQVKEGFLEEVPN